MSTDDKDIIRIADRCGALAPFIRPARLASDSAKTIDVLLHAISWLEREGQIYDIVVLLQPTSPLRSVADIDTAIKLLFKKQASAIVSVCRDEHHPFWANTLPRSGSMKKFMRKELRNKRSQDLPVFYRLNGAVYVIYSEALKREKDFYGDRTFAYIMPGKRSVDIDNELDFGFAEYLVKKR